MAHTHSTHHTEPTSTVEPDAVNVRAVAGFAVGLFVVALGSHLAMALMLSMLNSRADASNPPRMFPLAPLATEPSFPGDPSGQQPPEPRLQSDPKKELADLREAEAALLDGYGWVDRNNSVVRIPIEIAMKLTLERGLPSRETAASAPAAAAAPATENQGREQGK